MEAASSTDKRRLRVYGRSISCKPGCHGCCKRYLTVSLAEAMVMHDHLKKRGQWEQVRQEADDQYRRYGRVTDLVWFKMNISCPVLDRDTGMCRAHQVRPPACAAHFATSDPDLCDPLSTAGGEYRPVEMRDVVEKFRNELSESLAEHGILQMRLPLPVALLMAERISVRSGMSLEQAISLIRNELTPSNRREGTSRSSGS